MAAPIGNKYAVGNNGGRPPLYEDAEVFVKEIDCYFDYIKGEWHLEDVEIKKGGKKITIKEKVWDRMPEPATLTGLALYMGFESKQSLYDYGEKEEFSYPIKKARSRVEHEYEKGLHLQGCTGAIFALKNMGWKDKVETGFTDKDGEDLKGLPIVFK